MARPHRFAAIKDEAPQLSGLPCLTCNGEGQVASPVTMAWWKGISSGPVMLMWALDEVFTGYYGDPHLDIEGVPDLEHLPWIDPTHPP
jgi:hypothetical protein